MGKYVNISDNHDPHSWGVPIFFLALCLLDQEYISKCQFEKIIYLILDFELYFFSSLN